MMAKKGRERRESWMLHKLAQGFACIRPALHYGYIYLSLINQLSSRLSTFFLRKL